jgi:hypothetical protein
MNKNINVRFGLQYGLIIGIVYCALLFFRWHSSVSTVQFGMGTLLSYMLVVVLLFFEAFQRKKSNAGFISLKELFQTLFISVLVFELLFSVYNYIHVTYIEPEAVTRITKDLIKTAEETTNTEQKKLYVEAIASITKFKEVSYMIRNYPFCIAISGIVSFVVAVIMKKNKPVTQQ